MALGYGYVRDDDPVQINWREISKSFTDRIKADQADRQKRKDDIQAEYNQLQKDLINKPQGYNTDLNKVVGSFANQASVASLDLLNKLKTGQISEQEYYTKRANLKSSTENFFLYSNNFNKNYDQYMKLATSNDPDNRLSGKAMFQMGLASDMLDFKNTTAIVDPGTNELILVKTDEEGNPTNEIVNVSQLGYLSSQEELSYNYKDQIDKAIKRKGAKRTRDKNGKETITILGAILDTEKANTTIDALADSLLGDEAQVLSILYQNGYEFTQDESMKGKDKTIYFDINTNEYDYDRNDAKNILIEDIKGAIPETIIEPKELTANEKEIERLRIEVLKNQVEKGNIEIKGLRADDIDTSNLQSEVKRTINETIGQELESTFNNNYYSLAGPARKKASNAVKASLGLLNNYGSGFATTITEDGTNITFSTPAFDAAGKELSKPIEIKYSLENITDGNTVKALLENFITLYPGKKFINSAYKTGRFNQSTGTVMPPTQTPSTSLGTETTTVVESQTDELGLPTNTTTTPTGTVQTTTETTPTTTVVEENITTQEDSPAVIQAKRRTWIKKIKPLTLDEKNDDGSPVFDRSKFQSTARFSTVTEKVGGKVKDKFLTAEFARLYPDYPHEIYGQTEVFGKAEEIEANKKQTAADKIKARKNKQAKDKLLRSQTKIERLIEEVEQEAGRDLSIEEQVEIEKGNLPDIDFSSDFKEKYSYLFD